MMQTNQLFEIYKDYVTELCDALEKKTGMSFVSFRQTTLMIPLEHFAESNGLVNTIELFAPYKRRMEDIG